MILTKLFGFNAETMTVRKEVIAGLTTFLTMAYILAVNPAILHNTGMDQGAVFTATAVAAILATLVMAVYAKLPFALAPGMGLNAFFAYSVVLMMGYTWQFALTAVLLEGILFIILTVTGLRKKIVEALPAVLCRAINPGIGLFIAFIGLKNGGIVCASESTLVTLGNLHDSGVLLSIFAIILSAVLIVKKVTGGLLIGIVAATLVGIPLGITHFTSAIDIPPSLAPVFCQFEWNSVFTADMAICVMTFLFMDMFDTIGTLIGISNSAGMVDKDGRPIRMNRALMADAIGTLGGAILGTQAVTTFSESAAGINAGGRSGLTSFVAAMCFVLALFFAPIFLAIPTQATSAALVLVGIIMASDLLKLKMEGMIDIIPCFICIFLMPFTYSISEGILMGVISYVLLRLLTGRWKELNLGMVILAVLFVLKYMFL